MDLGEARRPYEMGYIGCFVFPLPPEELWGDIQRLDRYEQWFRWLRNVEVEGSGLRRGTVLRGVIVPPVPYPMRVGIRLVDCRRAERIDASVRGDLRGPARLRIRPADGGSCVRIGWRLEMRKPSMRVAARVAYPALRWGHDHVVLQAVDGYWRHLRREGLAQ
ncbi:MAG: hypothetical protein KY462_00325 [Actinobacteria bacterium]|nr:hypothetical protein [Actinomycetota bacterium]